MCRFPTCHHFSLCFPCKVKFSDCLLFFYFPSNYAKHFESPCSWKCATQIKCRATASEIQTLSRNLRLKMEEGLDKMSTVVLENPLNEGPHQSLIGNSSRWKLFYENWFSQKPLLRQPLFDLRSELLFEKLHVQN